MLISNSLSECLSMQLEISIGPVYLIFGSHTSINLYIDMVQMELESKEQDLCFRESSNKYPKRSVKYFISCMLNSNKSMDYTHMQYKFMIEWL